MELILRSLTSEQENKYQKLIEFLRNQEKIEPGLFSDSTVLRFVQSVDFNIDEALPAIRKSYEWRKSFDWTKITTPNQQLLNLLYDNVKIGFYGSDFEGRPIKIIQPGNFDFAEVTKSVPENVSFNFQLANIERLINIIFEMSTAKFQKHVYQQIVIVDIKNINFGKIISNTKMMEILKSRSGVFQDNYPEVTHKSFVLNAGSVFYIFWNIVALFLKKKTLEKVRILKKNYMPELLKITTIDRIPVSLGGTCLFEIDNYPNFFDDEIYRSVIEKRLHL